MIHVLNSALKTFLESRILLLQSLHRSLADIQSQINLVDRKQLQSSFDIKREERLELELLRDEMSRQQIQLERLLIELENQPTLLTPPN